MITRTKRQQLEDEIRELLAEQMGMDAGEITSNASLVDDLGLDSVDIMEIVVVYEEKHGVEIDDDRLDNVTTFAQLAEALGGK
jgi:acyl carrier protein